VTDGLSEGLLRYWVYGCRLDTRQGVEERGGVSWVVGMYEDMRVEVWMFDLCVLELVS
jgi:hypothetical protein